MKKIGIGNKLYDVTTMSEYNEMKDAFNPKFTAIETANGVTLPIKGRNDTGPGIYFQGNGMVALVEKPDEEHKEMYSSEKIIDYSNLKNIDDVISKDKLVRDIENDILTTKENIFHLNIGNNDTPEMVVFKKAVNTKQVDMKQYEPRCEQYQNDLRLWKGETITLGKLVSSCNIFDIDVIMTLRDKKGDIANPMNTEITINLTDRG